jgi:hypothetical protein
MRLDHTQGRTMPSGWVRRDSGSSLRRGMKKPEKVSLEAHGGDHCHSERGSRKIGQRVVNFLLPHQLMKWDADALQHRLGIFAGRSRNPLPRRHGLAPRRELGSARLFVRYRDGVAESLLALYEEESMKLQIISVWLVSLGTLQSPAAAQDWSSWITSNNRDLQYRWLGSVQGGSATCQLQVRDLKRKANTVVSLRIDYKFNDVAQSTRDVVTITEFKDESLGERTVYHCMSVDNLHVNEAVRW